VAIQDAAVRVEDRDELVGVVRDQPRLRGADRIEGAATARHDRAHEDRGVRAVVDAHRDHVERQDETAKLRSEEQPPRDDRRDREDEDPGRESQPRRAAPS
jgi:hypothetical protein